MEIGPRLKLELIKVQDGIDDGEVLYHKIIKKSSQELERLKKEAPKKKWEFGSVWLSRWSIK